MTFLLFVSFCVWQGCQPKKNPTILIYYCIHLYGFSDVCLNVSGQATKYAEPFTAQWEFIWLFPYVCPHVFGQATRYTKNFTLQCAFIWILSFLCLHMSGNVTGYNQCFIILYALIWLFSYLYPHVGCFISTTENFNILCLPSTVMNLIWLIFKVIVALGYRISVNNCF